MFISKGDGIFTEFSFTGFLMVIISVRVEGELGHQTHSLFRGMVIGS